MPATIPEFFVVNHDTMKSVAIFFAADLQGFSKELLLLFLGIIGSTWGFLFCRSICFRNRKDKQCESNQCKHFLQSRIPLPVAIEDYILVFGSVCQIELSKAYFLLRCARDFPREFQLKQNTKNHSRWKPAFPD